MRLRSLAVHPGRWKIWNSTPNRQRQRRSHRHRASSRLFGRAFDDNPRPRDENRGSEIRPGNSLCGRWANEATIVGGRSKVEGVRLKVTAPTFDFFFLRQFKRIKQKITSFIITLLSAGFFFTACTAAAQTRNHKIQQSLLQRKFPPPNSNYHAACACAPKHTVA